MVNYQGISEAVLIHALYHGTQPRGMGHLQHLRELTVQDVQQELDAIYKRPQLGVPVMNLPNREHDGAIYLDYYHGHPFKIRIDAEKKEFEPRLFDRDNGAGRAQQIVDGLREAQPTADVSVVEA